MPRPDTQNIVDRAKEARQDGGATTPSLYVDLDALFRDHEQAIQRVCRRIVPDPARAEELAQEALLTAWKRLPDYDGDRAKFSTWLVGIARYHCYNAVRRKSELLSEDGVIDPADVDTMEALSALQRAEREALLRRASATLDAVEQEAVYLRYVEGLGQAEITRVLDLKSSSGARGMLQSCRRKLARVLRKELEAMGHTSSFIREP